MSDNTTTLVGHIALMVVSVCNVVVTLLNHRKLRHVEKQMNGKSDQE